MVRRWVKKVNKAVLRGEKSIMWECNLSIYGMKENVDVLLTDGEYNMILERGYYLC